MGLSSNSTNQSSIGSWFISVVIPVIAAIVITALLAPFIAVWLNLPMPMWLSPWLTPWQQLTGQTIMLSDVGPNSSANGEGVSDGTAATDSSGSADTGDVWPTPPSDLLAASGLVTSTINDRRLTPTATRTPRPTSTIIVLPTPSWEELNYLSSIKFTASTLVETKRSTTIALFGDITTDRLLVQAVGEVLVGVDLSQVSNVEVDERSIRLSLPEPDVMAVELLPKESQIYESERTLFLSQYDGLETDALEQARLQLRIEVGENDGLMQVARDMSRLKLTEFLESVGFRDIEIEFPYLDTTREKN